MSGETLKPSERHPYGDVCTFFRAVDALSISTVTAKVINTDRIAGKPLRSYLYAALHAIEIGEDAGRMIVGEYEAHYRVCKTHSGILDYGVDMAVTNGVVIRVGFSLDKKNDVIVSGEWHNSTGDQKEQVQIEYSNDSIRLLCPPNSIS